MHTCCFGNRNQFNNSVIHASYCFFTNPLFFFFFIPLLQRAGTRRRYHDDGISDEEIDGRRMFDLEEKVNSQRFSSDRVLRMEGKGRRAVQTVHHCFLPPYS